MPELRAFLFYGKRLAESFLAALFRLYSDAELTVSSEPADELIKGKDRVYLFSELKRMQEGTTQPEFHPAQLGNCGSGWL